MSSKVIGIIGNPNSGKSTIFNLLTKLNQKISNWPGVTVEKKSGRFEIDKNEIELLDLPGIYSLGIGEHTSIDQKIAIDFLKQENFDLIINVIDSSNLYRHLYLTLQLLEMNIPVLIVLNMQDLANKKGIKIDQNELKKCLSCEIVASSAINKKSVFSLKQAIAKSLNQQRNTYNIINFYPEVITLAIRDIMNNISVNTKRKCWEAVKYLEGNKPIEDKSLENKVKYYKQQIERLTNETAEHALINARYGVIDNITEKYVRKVTTSSFSLSDKLDKILLNNYLGLPIFFFVMYFIFMISISFGTIFQEFFQLISEAFVIKTPLLLIQGIPYLAWSKNIILGIGGGIQTAVSFLPIIIAVYFLLSFIEDIGYMSRISFVAEKFFNFLGLPGQAILPLIIGLGCNVPSITATRILSNQKDRIITILMAPFISCSARFSVYIIFALIFFPKNAQNVIFLLYIFGILVATFTGFITKKYIVKKTPTPLFIELPEYKLPSFTNVLMNSWGRAKSFLFGAGKYIIIAYFVLYIINSLNLNFHFIKQKEEPTVLEYIGKTITPIFKPIGIKEENWPAAVGLFTGIFAKEVVIGTLIPLYSSLEEINHIESEESKSFLQLITLAFKSIYTNFISCFTGAQIPYFNIVSDDMQNELFSKNNVDSTFIKSITKYFDNPYSVIAYLLFILLYFPCLSVFGAIYNEIGLKWAIFSVFWSTGSAYFFSFLFYQICIFLTQPWVEIFD